MQPFVFSTQFRDCDRLLNSMVTAATVIAKSNCGCGCEVMTMRTVIVLRFGNWLFGDEVIGEERSGNGSIG